MFSKALFAVLLLACLSVVKAEEDVVVLTDDNFSEYVGKEKGAFVKFYAPWCGHCKKLAPDYEKFGTAFKKTKSVVIGKVDCDVHKSACNKHGVKGFPTLKWFPAGSDKAEDYDKGRDLESLIGFVNEKLGTNVKLAVAPSDVVVLTPQNFESVVLDKEKNVLVEFYAPWCGHCKSLAPIYDSLGTVFKTEKNVVIAKVDADAHKDLGEKYGVSGFPTLKWFSTSNKDGVSYEGGRDLENLVEYINAEAGTSRTTSGSLSEKAGKIDVLDTIAAEFLEASEEERKSLIANAEVALQGVKEDKAKAAAHYLKVMKSIQVKGAEYVEKESARLSRILSGSLKAEKVDDLTIKKNILLSFQK